MQRIEAGVGNIVLQRYGSEAVFSQLSFKYPLKLLSPKIAQENVAVVYVLTYGGGLVGGDRVRLNVSVEGGSVLVMLSQGTTKVFKSRPGQRLSRSTPSEVNGDITSQHLDVSVSPGSTLCLLPDPVTCFRSAKYNQLQRFRLEGDASAILLDWITSGRKSIGEDWVFERFSSLNEVWVDGKRVARDAMLLEDEDEKPEPDTTTSAKRKKRRLADKLNPYSCYATVLLYGPVTTTIVKDLSEEYESIRVFKQSARPSLIWSFSKICGGKGGILRVAGTESEDVRKWLGRGLRSLEAVVGRDTYRRAFG
ncbi:UreD-domain-containing protein [Panus rudis PR-1116 ss-1]|nr:UreD-domain-containing protein [Panus rudis PR-1116 ss-1]